MVFPILMAAAVAWSAGRTIYTGKDLMEACSGNDKAGLLVCKGYVDATISTTEMFRAVSYQEHKTPQSDQTEMLCPPGGSLSLTQETAAIDLYLIAHPEAATAHAPIAIVNGLSAAYPCTKP